MARSRLVVAITLATIAVASSAACTFLVPVDDLMGGPDAVDLAADGAAPQDASLADSGTDTKPPVDSASLADGALDASADADAAPTLWTLLGNSSPVGPSDPSTAAVEVGLRFSVSAPGDIVAIRFFRTVSNPDGYVVHLWAPDGTLLATAVVPADNGQPIGWRQQAIARTHVTPSGFYVASYFSSHGNYSFTSHGFATALTSGPLTAPANGDSGTNGNGIFDYSMTPLTIPPASSFDETNYFVDVELSPTP